MPDIVSVPPVAETVTEATFCQDKEPPETVGAPGVVRSSRTVACVQPEALPTLSTPRNCTRVSPCAVIALDVAVAMDDQVVPPLVDVRTSYRLRPEPPVSVEPDGVTLTDEEISHSRLLPVTTGAVGAVRSSLTVLVAPAVAGTQAETLPAPSIERSWTIVVPSAVIGAEAPAVADDHVVPPLVDVRCW